MSPAVAPRTLSFAGSLTESLLSFDMMTSGVDFGIFPALVNLSSFSRVMNASHGIYS